MYMRVCVQEKEPLINSSSHYTDIYSKLDAFLSNDDIYGAPAVFELLHTHLYSIVSAILCVYVCFLMYSLKGPCKDKGL